MDAILNWMKGILILFLIGHVLLYLVQNKTYEKYVHFFLRILILLAVMAPIASRLIDEDTLIQNMEQAQFFQELENVQNINAISSAETADYRLQYEEACSGQVEDTLRQKGYAVAYSKVTLNEVYEIEYITIGMEKSGDNIEKNSSVHVSDVEIPAIEIKETEEKKEHTSQEYAELEKFVCKNYLVDKTQIQIEEVRR